jgi:hypothetical protein
MRRFTIVLFALLLGNIGLFAQIWKAKVINIGMPMVTGSYVLDREIDKKSGIVEEGRRTIIEREHEPLQLLGVYEYRYPDGKRRFSGIVYKMSGSFKHRLAEKVSNAMFPMVDVTLVKRDKKYDKFLRELVIYEERASFKRANLFRRGNIKMAEELSIDRLKKAIAKNERYKKSHISVFDENFDCGAFFQGNGVSRRMPEFYIIPASEKVYTSLDYLKTKDAVGFEYKIMLRGHPDYEDLLPQGRFGNQFFYKEDTSFRALRPDGSFVFDIPQQSVTNVQRLPAYVRQDKI